MNIIIEHIFLGRALYIADRLEGDKVVKIQTKNQMGNICLVFHTISRNGSSEIQNRSGRNLWRGIHSFTGSLGLIIGLDWKMEINSQR
mgnify:CR=1 FL=1